MQEIKRAALIKRASELLSDGTADRVLGWKAGEFDYDVTPAVFHSAEELEKLYSGSGSIPNSRKASW